MPVLGVPLPTRLYGYQLRGGRWLDPGGRLCHRDEHALARDVGVGVGDWVTINYDEKRERDCQVVGLVFDPLLITLALVDRASCCCDDLGSVGRAPSWSGPDRSGAARTSHGEGAAQLL